MPADKTEEDNNEKHHDLAKAPTANSHAGGHSVQPIKTREDGSEYPTGVRLALITLALCLSVFLIALDNSIIATAIPTISDAFQSLSDVGWYGSGKHRRSLVSLSGSQLTNSSPQHEQPTSSPRPPCSSSSASSTRTLA